MQIPHAHARGIWYTTAAFNLVGKTRKGKIQNPRKLSAYIKKRLKSDGKMNYVFIDEIQLCYKVRKEGVGIEDVAPEDRDSVWLTFYDVLNSLNARRNVDIYVTGSNSKMLSKDVSTNFRGRKTELQLMPLSFAEFHGYRKGEKDDDWQEYLRFGGLPQVVLAATEREKAATLNELFGNQYLVWWRLSMWSRERASCGNMRLILS